ncbi:hypothetical protein [Methylobacterium terrae]|uniref:hypothetical protein n=1 Tax=Methylobacterium terrae TaxID=2202827 RepID=UPI0013A54DA3|nr:hypothetical protein [Methylobacterium terrae]
MRNLWAFLCMLECPDYRLRLFLSVDLVGSTAFKSKHADRREENEPYPVWLNRTRSFYRHFPQMLNKHYNEFLGVVEHRNAFSEMAPKIWKTVGDEIIFCIRIICLEHLSYCMKAFVRALSSYGEAINRQEKELDVKGCAWIVSFPAPNATVLSPSGASGDMRQTEIGAQLDEADEIKADFNPREYDFLGKQIDTGFRVSKFAQSHELALSIDLAWLLTLVRHRDLVDFNFLYKGREALKGVIGGIPYPIITIQTERSVHRRELEALERSVNGTGFAEPFGLHKYIYKFMEINEIEMPILKAFGESIESEELPICYKNIKSAWNSAAQETDKREILKDEANKYEDQENDSDGASLSTDPIEYLDSFMEKITKE